MTIRARAVRTLAAAAALTLAGAAPALAAYPEKPIQIIVPFGAGDAIDGTARVIADRLKDELGVPVIVRNIAGAGGGKGTAEAATAPADGYTLLMGSTGALTARPIIADSGYETSDFVPIAQLVEVPIGLAVAADSPYKSIGDVVEAARKGGLKYSTPGPGSTQHINMERFAKGEGLDMTHIGGQGGKGAVTKALSGEVDFVFVGASNYTGLADAGQLRVIGVANAARVPYLPDAPTFDEQGHPLDVTVWFGLLAPKGTPDAALATLRKAVAKVTDTDETRDLYKKFNFNEAYLDADSFQARIDETVSQNKTVLKDIGLAK